MLVKLTLHTLLAAALVAAAFSWQAWDDGLAVSAASLATVLGSEIALGEDAGLDAALAAEIEAYLVGHAGRGDGTKLRTTEQRWFRHEHDLPDQMWQRPGVRSRANGEACRRDAAHGIFEDDRVPAHRGMGRSTLEPKAGLAGYRKRASCGG